MSKPTVSFDELAKFAPVILLIRGKVSYSHISKKYEGEELKKVNARRASKNMKPSNAPFYDITIKDAYLINPEGYDPLLRKGIEERFYTQMDNDTGINSIMWKSSSTAPNLPMVAYSAEAGADIEGHGIADKDVPLKAELANGLDVTLGVKLFVNQNGAGLGLDFVLCNEPIRYYSNDGLASILAAAGITYVPPTLPTEKENAVPVSVSPMAEVIPESIPQHFRQVIYPQPVSEQMLDKRTMQMIPNQPAEMQNLKPMQNEAFRFEQFQDQSQFEQISYPDEAQPSMNESNIRMQKVSQEPRLFYKVVNSGQVVDGGQRVAIPIGN